MKYRNLSILARVGAFLGVMSLSEFYLVTQGYWGIWGLIPAFLALILGTLTLISNRDHNDVINYFGVMATVLGATIFGIFGSLYGISLLLMAKEPYFFL